MSYDLRKRRPRAIWHLRYYKSCMRGMQEACDEAGHGKPSRAMAFVFASEVEWLIMPLVWLKIIKRNVPIESK